MKTSYSIIAGILSSCHGDGLFIVTVKPDENGVKVGPDELLGGKTLVLLLLIFILMFSGDF